MKFETKVKILFHKRYFDEGYGTTSYLKLVVGVVGISGVLLGMSKTLIVLLFITYALFCYIFGRFWIKHKWAEAAIEVNNRIDRFVREMRRKIK